jgi:hypothetical protein
MTTKITPFDIAKLSACDKKTFSRSFLVLQQAILEVGMAVKDSDNPEQLRTALVKAYKGEAVDGTQDVVCEDSAMSEYVKETMDIIKQINP